jgi:RHS repeat-associated protein
LLSFAYELDKAGNRKQVTELGGSYIKWDYDNLYRLKGETRYNSSNAITWQAGFTYDAAGNRDSMTVNSATTTYQYNALDQLTSAGAITYNYDGRGNLNKVTNGSQITNYTYNAADQLASVILPNNTNITYGYDADGRRVKQTVGSAVTNYLWDEASTYGDVILETDGSNNTLARYILGGNQLLSQTRGSTTNYFLQDGQGSIRALTNTNNPATVTDTYSYNAFGDLFTSSGTTVNPYRYTGQQFDSLTSLYSLRARYYNSGLGRFFSQDTYPVGLGNPVELNRYVYVANNPVNAIDPSGHFLEYAAPLQQNANIGSSSLPAIAAYTSAVVIGIAFGLMLGEVVEAPPKGNTIQELYNNVRSPFPPEYKPGGGRAPGWPIGLAVFLLCLLNPDLCIPDPSPTREPSEPEREFIYREGNKARNLRLHRIEDKKTGLSFFSEALPEWSGFIKFRVATLRAHGYTVQFDANKPSRMLPFYGGDLYMGVNITLHMYHVTVFIDERTTWEQWYDEEQKYKGTEDCSDKTNALYALSENYDPSKRCHPGQ